MANGATVLEARAAEHGDHVALGTVGRGFSISRMLAVMRKELLILYAYPLV